MPSCNEFGVQQRYLKMTKSPPDKSPMESINLPRLLAAITWTRLISALAVLSSLAGALLMFWLGTIDTINVFRLVLHKELSPEEAERGLSVIATVDLLESLDDFLVGLAFLYFAYGIYSLFIRIHPDPINDPPWLQVDSISDLKKTLLEVLVVLLSVVFIKGVLEHVTILTMNWNLLVIPLSIVAIALAIRLMLSEGESKED
jgi:uncharacterized membrane protein YqhA